MQRSRGRTAFERLETRALLTASGYSLSMASALDMLSPASSNPSGMVAIGNEAYFVADDGTHGNQLWTSDGTAAGTERITDIPSAPDIRDLTAVGTTLFFTVDDEALWKSDGTQAGTVQVADLNEGYDPGSLTGVGGTLFFTAALGAGADTGGALWKSDGTAAGTIELHQFSSDLFEMPRAALAGDLYFAAPGSNGTELWKSDGTAGGTVEVQALDIGSMADIDGQLYISNEDDGEGDNTVWKSDGTTVTLVTNALPDAASDFTGVNGTVYFVDGGSLWKTDGTAAGTSELLPSSTASYITRLDNLGGALYLTSYTSQSNQTLSSLNPSGEIVNLIPAPGVGAVSTPIEAGGLIFFDVGDNGVTMLWVSDGTASGTHQLEPSTPTAPLSPSSLTAVGGKLLFAASDGLHGDELWSSDGTVAGTALVDDINPGYSQLQVSASVQFDNATFLVIGSDLWKTDGTASGSTLLSQTAIGDLVALRGSLYFLAADGLLKTDGTLAGTTSVTPGGGPANVSSLVEFNGALYFLAEDGAQLWMSDGTTAGTALITSLPPWEPPSFASNPPKLISGGGLLLIDLLESVLLSQGTASTTAQVYPDGGLNGFAPVPSGAVFSTDDGDLVKTDGTAAGTVLLRSFGSQISLDSSFSNIGNLTAVNGLAVFTAKVNGVGQLWATDGTVAGTTMLEPDLFTYSFAVLGNKAYFASDDGTHGEQLWVTDGTAAGTQPITNVNATETAGGLAPQNLAAIDGRLFFGGNDGVHGDEPWVGDGTASGSLMIADLNPGAAGSQPVQFIPVGGRILFIANDGTDGVQPWLLTTPPMLGLTVASATGGVEGVSPADLTDATFTDANTGAALSDFGIATVDWGDGSKDSTGLSISGSGGTFTVTGSHLYADEGLHNFTLVVKDTAGDTATITGSANVADASLTPGTFTPPVATEGKAFGPLTVFQFSDANPNATAADFTATIATGDATLTSTAEPQNVSIIAASGGGFDVKLGYTYAEQLSGKTFGVSVADMGGASATSNATSFSVADQPLVAQPGTLSTSLNAPAAWPAATFTDPGGAQAVDNYIATIDWGDGNTTAGTVTPSAGRTPVPQFTVSGTHAYAIQGAHSPIVTIVHDGATISTTASVSVSDGPLVVTPASLTASLNASAILAVATFTDPGGAQSVGDYSASIDWGDGNTTTATLGQSAGGTPAPQFTVSGSHAYAAQGAHAPVVTIVHDGASISTTASVGVSDGPLVVTPATLTASLNASATLAVATFTDPGGIQPVSDYRTTIDWGDGNTTTGTISRSAGGTPAPQFTVSGSHAYAAQGAHAPVVTILHDGATVTATATVSVNDPALSATPAMLSATQGEAATFNLATFTDPGGAQPVGDYRAIIDWGDGSSGTASIDFGGGVFTISGSHSYTQSGTMSAVVTIDHGSALPLTATAAVNVLSGEFVVDDQTYTIGSGTVNVSAVNGLLTGDKGTSLAVTAGTVTGAQGGTFAFNSDGSFTYTPGADLSGYDSAPFTVTDASGDTATHTITVLSQHAAVVWKFYESVLNRAPDPAGLQYWTDYFDNGGQTGQMAVGFFESTELLDQIIDNYYQQYLLRTPDASGLAYWVSQWQATGEPEGIKAGFADSPEFYNSSGGTPQAWLTQLYERILQRTADASGYQYWLNYYQQQTAAGVATGTVEQQIALGFFDSPEAYDDDVTGWFNEYLGRNPTSGEQTQYVDQMQSGATDRTIEQEITNLPEYANNPPAPADGTAAPLPDYYPTPAASASSQAVVAAKDNSFSQF